MSYRIEFLDPVDLIEAGSRSARQTKSARPLMGWLVPASKKQCRTACAIAVKRSIFCMVRMCVGRRTTQTTYLLDEPIPNNGIACVR